MRLLSAGLIVGTGLLAAVTVATRPRETNASADEIQFVGVSVWRLAKPTVPDKAALTYREGQAGDHQPAASAPSQPAKGAPVPPPAPHAKPSAKPAPIAAPKPKPFAVPAPADVPPPRLGVYMAEVTPENCARFGQKSDHGVFVERIVQGSAAEKAGLQTGDCVIAVGAVRIDGGEQLARVVGGARGGATIVTVLRGGKKVQFTCVLPADTTSPDEQF